VVDRPPDAGLQSIADFRKDNGEAIRKVCRAFVLLCRRLDLLGGASVAIDGSKFKAVNNRDKNFTRAKVERRRAQLGESVARYLSQLDTADRQPPSEALVAKTKGREDRRAQYRLEAVELKVRLIDLRSRPEEEREAEARRLEREEVNRPFNLSADLLVRATLLRLEAQDYRLILMVHHIVADEWSLKILFGELAAFYEGVVQGNPPTLPELPIQYADYAAWQRDWLQGEALEQHLAYWRERFNGTPPTTELPTDRPRRLSPTFDGGNVTLRLGPDLSEALKELGRRHDATLFMSLRYFAVRETLSDRSETSYARANSTGSPASRRSVKLTPFTTRPASTSRHGMTRTATVIGARRPPATPRAT